MNSETVTAYLSLGSNLGERQENLDEALDYLSQRMQLVKVSSVYDTEAVGNSEQPRFFNLGRQPGKVNAPRPIDIDILFYGNEVINTKELVIPHPRLTERAFVLVPLVEIAPKLMHPISDKTVKELLGELKKGLQGILRLENS